MKASQEIKRDECHKATSKGKDGQGTCFCSTFQQITEQLHFTMRINESEPLRSILCLVNPSWKASSLVDQEEPIFLCQCETEIDLPLFLSSIGHTHTMLQETGNSQWATGSLSTKNNKQNKKLKVSDHENDLDRE